MRLGNRGWLCVMCGAELDAPIDKRPYSVLMGASGKRTVRALRIDGREIHRCESGRS